MRSCRGIIFQTGAEGVERLLALWQELKLVNQLGVTRGTLEKG